MSDEREALISAIAGQYFCPLEEGGEYGSHIHIHAHEARAIAGIILAAGFRRPAQTEPTDIQFAGRRSGKSQALIDSMLAQANERGIRVEVVYPQAKPTDEEREALSNFLFTVYEHGSQPNALREADAILGFLASHRPAQAPTDDEREALELLIAKLREAKYPEGLDAWVTGDVAHAILAAGFRRPAQTEPTDAQVKAGVRALDEYTGLEMYPDEMRAALKAAFTAGQEEQS